MIVKRHLLAGVVFALATVSSSALAQGSGAGKGFSPCEVEQDGWSKRPQMIAQGEGLLVPSAGDYISVACVRLDHPVELGSVRIQRITVPAGQCVAVPHDGTVDLLQCAGQ